MGGRMENRVVITGMGVVSAIGNEVNTFWAHLKAGKCGIKALPRELNIRNTKVHTAAYMEDFTPAPYLEPKDIRRLAEFSQYAVYASRKALDQAQINMDKEDPNKVGVIVGSGLGDWEAMYQETKNLEQYGGMGVSPLFVPMSIANMAAGNVAIYTGARGICTSVVTACATGTNSIGEAFRNLKYGWNDVIIAGGTEKSVTKLGVAGFMALNALSTSEDPGRASIPFDKERGGFVLGDGAGIIVMETLSHARNRGAEILAEIVGYGASGDAYHITTPSPSGEGAAYAMRQAILEAGIQTEEIDYINAHGTGTVYNDQIETLAIKNVFGNKTKLAVSSTKSMTGHLLGAAGGIEAIATIKSVMDDFIPPTIGYEIPDEACDLDYVPNVGRQMGVKYAMSNSLGFGGHNASIIIKKWEDK